MIAMAKKLKLRVVGVQTEQQLALLKANQCDEVRGFLIGRPAAPDAIAARLGAERQRHRA